MEEAMETKVTLVNQINAVRQSLESDYVARLNHELMLKDNEAVPDDAPKAAKEALQASADVAKIQLALINQRIKTREPVLADLERKQKEASQ
jgi:hypothetical protein